jgi:hypothetical protein
MRQFLCVPYDSLQISLLLHTKTKCPVQYCPCILYIVYQRYDPLAKALTLLTQLQTYAILRAVSFDIQEVDSGGPLL